MLNFLWQGFLTRGLYVLIGIAVYDAIRWIVARYRPEPPRKYPLPIWVQLIMIGLLVLFFSCVPVIRE